MQLTLTEQEGQNLVTLIDAACKAGGLQAALIAVPLFAKLQEAAAASAEPAPEPAKETE